MFIVFLWLLLRYSRTLLANLRTGLTLYMIYRYLALRKCTASSALPDTVDIFIQDTNLSTNITSPVDSFVNNKAFLSTACCLQQHFFSPTTWKHHVLRHEKATLLGWDWFINAPGGINMKCNCLLFSCHSANTINIPTLKCLVLPIWPWFYEL